MPLNVPLSQLLTDLRAESGRSLTPALGAGDREHLILLLRRTQEMLATAHEWPHLTVYRDSGIGATQRYIAYPSDMPFELVAKGFVKQGSVWRELGYGIGPEQYSAYDSEAGVTGSEPLRWQHVPDSNSIELWPVPAASNTLRLWGRRSLRPLVNDADPCDLDSNVIVLHAAAELLARQKQEDAAIKLQAAQVYLRTLLARQGSAKLVPFVVGGGVDPASGVSGDRWGWRAGVGWIP